MTLQVTRFSVRVNTRDNVRANMGASCYESRMMSNWRIRLEEAIQADGRSLRRLSDDAQCGPNFVQQLLKDEKDPRASQLARLLKTLGPVAEAYVLTGLRLSPLDLEFLEAMSSLDDDAQKDALSLLRRLSSGVPAQKPDGATQE